ncbi:MAG: hypothetical protein U0528_09480 [Anaerolineae bacterium]
MVVLKVSSSAVNVSNKLFAKWFSAPVRYELTRGEAQPLRVRSDYQWLRVLTGVAWIAYNDNAAVLRDGEAIELSPEMGQIMISAEKGVPLSFEILRGEE